jgi:hypothetical protein
MGRLFVNLQHHGFVESFLSSFYYNAAMTARFDSTSHFAPTYLTLGLVNCALYATTPSPGCSANFGSAPAYSPNNSLAAKAEAAATSLASAAPSGSSGSSTPPSQSQQPPQSPRAAQSAIANLLRGSAQVTGQVLQRLTALLAGGKPPITQTLQNLVSYLLK